MVKPLLIFVIETISVQNTNLHLTVGMSGLGAKLNVTKSQTLEKIKIKQEWYQFVTVDYEG